MKDTNTIGWGSQRFEETSSFRGFLELSLLTVLLGFIKH